MQTYNRAFESCVRQDDNELLNRIWDYVSSKRGKQLRPMLTLLSAAVARGITAKTYDTAVAMELLHTASLIHDDVVDDSPLRRGIASVQDKWTNKIAVLAGDYMLSRVIMQTAKINNRQILQIVANLGMGLANGELLQLHHGETMWIARAQYYKVIEQKTAILFSACTEAGAISAGGTGRTVGALSRFGLKLGMAFQITDDILDYSDNDLGKPTLSDLRDGKVTLPLIYAMERAPREEAEAMRHLCEAIAEGGETDHLATDLQALTSYVMRYDGLGAARKVAAEYLDSALDELKIFHPSPVRDSLAELAKLALSRTK